MKNIPQEFMKFIKFARNGEHSGIRVYLELFRKKNIVNCYDHVF